MSTDARLLAAAMAGAAAVLAFAPFHAWPLAPLALALLFALLDGARPLSAFLLAFAWALGLFGAGASWVFVSLHTHGNMPALLAALATLLFCAYLALFPALALACGAWLAVRRAIDPVRALLLLFPALFTAAEMLRGWFLTGFPWLSLGHSQTPGGVLPAPLAGYAPLGGAHAIGLLIACTAGVLALVLRRAIWQDLRPRSRAGLLAATGALWALGGALQSVEWSEVHGEPLTVSLLQGNVPQEIKWREEAFQLTLARYRELVGAARGRLVILPETALPGFLDQIPAAYLEHLHALARTRGQDLLFGVPLAERDADGRTLRYYNTVLSAGTHAPQRYDKHHLVAFGEFIPAALSWVYRWLHIPLAGFTPGSAHSGALTLGALRLAVNICYEDAFGSEIAHNARDAHLMINVSNMAWFGRSLAAEQHAQFSRMRALENARWMLRSTNTGLTAAIDHKGRLVGALPQFQQGILELRVEARSGTTPYQRLGDVPALALIAALILPGGFIPARRARG